MKLQKLITPMNPHVKRISPRTRFSQRIVFKLVRVVAVVIIVAVAGFSIIPAPTTVSAASKDKCSELQEQLSDLQRSLQLNIGHLAFQEQQYNSNPEVALLQEEINIYKQDISTAQAQMAAEEAQVRQLAKDFDLSSNNTERDQIIKQMNQIDDEITATSTKIQLDKAYMQQEQNKLDSYAGMINFYKKLIQRNKAEIQKVQKQLHLLKGTSCALPTPPPYSNCDPYTYPYPCCSICG